jgi:RecB family endonuclease NucS
MQPQRILFLCDGKLVVGHYSVDEQGTVTAIRDGRRKSTQVGNSEPDRVAKWLLRELAREAA